MTGTARAYTVEGKVYKVWADFCQRATIAENEQGEQKQISGGGYIHNDLTVRKAIAARFGHQSFRK